MPQTVVHVATISSIKNLQTFDPNIISSLINKKNWERISYKVGEISLLWFQNFYKNLYTVLWYQNAKNCFK